MIVTGDVHNHSLFGVSLLLCQRFRPIGDLPALDDALSPRPLVVGAHNIRVRTGLCIVVLNIDIRRHKSLPDSVEIGLAVSRVRRLVGRKLPRRRNLRPPGDLGGALCGRRRSGTLRAGGGRLA